MASSNRVNGDDDTNDNDVNVNVNVNENCDNWPLWKYVEKQTKLGKGGGNTKFICTYCKNVYTGSYSRLKNHLKPKNHDALEFANFFGCFDEFGDEDSIRDRLKLDPLKWWVAYGIGAPHLRPIAVRLLGQVSFSSCCERNWSTYSFIHSTKRNQITPERAENLVFVHSNLHLLSKKAPQYMKGESKMWDVAGDAFDSMDDIEILGIANLSVDEPELESVLFGDDEEGPKNS